MKKWKSINPKTDPVIAEHYADIVRWLDALGIPYRIVEDGNKVYRFRPNAVLNVVRNVASQHGMSMNEIAYLGHDEDRVEYYVWTGYSLSGFAEIFGGQIDAHERKLKKKAKGTA